MDDITQDLFSVSDVQGIIVIAPDGNIVYQNLAGIALMIFDDVNNTSFESVNSFYDFVFTLFNNVEEADLLFETLRIYIRECPLGLLLVIMKSEAPAAAMVRLQCDILIPRMRQITAASGHILIK